MIYFVVLYVRVGKKLAEMVLVPTSGLNSFMPASGFNWLKLV